MTEHSNPTREPLGHPERLRRPNALTLFDAMVATGKMSSSAQDPMEKIQYAGEALLLAIDVRNSPENEQGAVTRRLDLMKMRSPHGEMVDPVGVGIAESTLEKADEYIADQTQRDAWLEAAGEKPTEEPRDLF